MGSPADKQLAHTERTHGDTSPSGADRWWNCPGSVALIAKLNPPRTTNRYSEQGTAAHELLDMCLSAGRAPIAFLGKVVNKASKEAVGEVFTVDKEMSICVEECLDYIQTLRRKGDRIINEKELEIPATGQPGHVDVALFCRDYIDVIDYKHGTDPVDVKGNKQATLYALGVWEYIRKHFPAFLKTIKKIRLHIIQPRSRSTNGGGPIPHEMTPSQLSRFAEEAKAKVLETRSPNAPLVPGKLQCKYCPASGRCQAQAKAACKAAQMDFADVISKKTDIKTMKHSEPAALSNTEIGNALTALPIMEMWIGAVRNVAAVELNAGRKIPGWKVVEGRSQRRWVDNALVVKMFKKLGIKEDDFMPRSLVGLGVAEALLPKPKREGFFLKTTTKPRGNPALAEENDPRPPYDRAQAAKQDFHEDILG